MSTPLQALAAVRRSMGEMDTERWRYAHGADGPAVDALSDAIMRQTDELAELQARVGTMAHRLGVEAGAWEEEAELLEAIRRPSLDVVVRVEECRARAAGLAEFVRSLCAPQDRVSALLDTSGIGPDDEPGVEPPLERERRLG